MDRITGKIPPCFGRFAQTGRRGCPCITGGNCRCARRAHKRRGNPFGSPSSCESPSPPSGRAARVKVSDAFRLPPNCHCGRQGIGCHPKRVRLHSTRPERRLHGNGKHKPYIASTPASRVRRKTELPRHNRKANFFHSMWTKFVCGRGQPRTSPAGVIDKRGQGPLLCARAAQAHASRRPQAAKS